MGPRDVLDYEVLYIRKMRDKDGNIQLATSKQSTTSVYTANNIYKHAKASFQSVRQS